MMHPRSSLLIAPLLVALLAPLLAACAGQNGGRWPSLAPRPGENSMMVQRVPAAMAVPAVAQPSQPATAVAVPADADARLAAAETLLSGMESAVPAAAADAERAVAAAAGQPADSNEAVAAEAARSRYESLFQPLPSVTKRLDEVGDAVAGVADAPAWRARIATLQARVDALQAARSRYR
jgi:hypothetical protein